MNRIYSASFTTSYTPHKLFRVSQQDHLGPLDRLENILKDGEMDMDAADEGTGKYQQMCSVHRGVSTAWRRSIIGAE
jgi:hypothetical protein